MYRQVELSPRLEVVPTARNPSVKLFGPESVSSIVAQSEVLEPGPIDSLRVSLSGAEFVRFAELVYLTAFLDHLIEKHAIAQTGLELADPRRIMRGFRGPLRRDRTTSRQLVEGDSDRATLRLLAFIESLGVPEILDRPSLSRRFLVPGFTTQLRRSLTYYSRGRSEGGHTVLMPIQRISKGSDPSRFGLAGEIQSWRMQMDRSHLQSPLFESGVVWKVFLVELAKNIVEHAGVEGMLAARVIDLRARSSSWRDLSFPGIRGIPIRSDVGQVLEIVAADAGMGFESSLRDAYDKYKKSAGANADDVLTFAFHDSGTRKADEERWLARRHALSTLRLIASSYGGAISVRSGTAENWFNFGNQEPNNHGSGGRLAPTARLTFQHAIPGAIVRVLLPLVPRVAAASRVARLSRSLPAGLRVDEAKAIGSRVLVKEYIEAARASLDRGSESAADFRMISGLVADRISMVAGPGQPLIFDLFGTNWDPPQLEAFLEAQRHCIASRPCLLVNADTDLIAASKELEWAESETERSGEAHVGGTHFAILKELHVAIIVLDFRGQRHLLGAPNAQYESALLRLTDSTISEESLVVEHQLEPRALRRLLVNDSPTFVKTGDLWSCVWGARALAAAASGSIRNNLSSVLEQCGAWLGAGPVGGRQSESDSQHRELYYLPWRAEWRTTFLDCSRLLDNKDLFDQVSILMVSRARQALEQRGLRLEDVGVLAGLSSPSVAIASGMYQWWIDAVRPSVIDLGVFWANSGRLPRMRREGRTIVIQDVIDGGERTEELCEALRAAGAEIAGVMALIEFEHELASRASKASVQRMESAGLFVSALFGVPRPGAVETEERSRGTAREFVVQPITLRATAIDDLRRSEGSSGVDGAVARRNEALAHYFDAKDSHILFGHFAHGTRHFQSTLDIRGLLEGDLGFRLARWVADICEGSSGRQAEEWEREEAKDLVGDVSVVLIPLHSQIHYLWPRIHTELARRGRQQPVWFVDVTQLQGLRPSDGLPGQLIQLLRGAKRRLQAAGTRHIQSGGAARLRVLVLDDAVATGKTASTILGALLDAASTPMIPANCEKSSPSSHRLSPIEWIRYFTVVNQSDVAYHSMLRNQKAVGEPSIRLLLEEFAPLMAVGISDEASCPVCREREQVFRVRDLAEAYGLRELEAWADQRAAELEPVALGGHSRTQPAQRFPTPLVMLGPSVGKPPSAPAEYRNVSTAIWKFFELFESLYPIGEVLDRLAPWPEDSQDEDEVLACERFRSAVLSRCLSDWERTCSLGADKQVIDWLNHEIDASTDALPVLFLLCGTRYADSRIQDAALYLAGEGRSLRATKGGGGAAEPSLGTNEVLALNLFILSSLVTRAARPRKNETGRMERDWSDFIRRISALEANPVSRAYSGQIGVAYLHAIGRGHQADPRWSLEVIAESLFREGHPLLSQLLFEFLRGPEFDHDAHQLESSLSLFLCAIRTIARYGDSALVDEIEQIEDCGEELLAGLRHRRSREDLYRTVGQLYSRLDCSEVFGSAFQRLFYISIEDCLGDLERYRSRVAPLLELDSLFVGEVSATTRFLANANAALSLLRNRIVDPALRARETRPRARLRFSRRPAQGEVFLEVRTLTNFGTFEAVRNLIDEGRHLRTDDIKLAPFGYRYGGLLRPTTAEADEGFTVVAEFLFPIGFSRRRSD